jgi:hypothetical protein
MPRDWVLSRCPSVAQNDLLEASLHCLGNRRAGGQEPGMGQTVPLRKEWRGATSQVCETAVGGGASGAGEAGHWPGLPLAMTGALRFPGHRVYLGSGPRADVDQRVMTGPGRSGGLRFWGEAVEY